MLRRLKDAAYVFALGDGGTEADRVLQVSESGVSITHRAVRQTSLDQRGDITRIEGERGTEVGEGGLVSPASTERPGELDPDVDIVHAATQGALVLHLR